MKLIDLTKKIACAAIAVSAFVLSGCNPDETGKNEDPVIKITPDNVEFDYRADEAVVTVESSEDWTLLGTYDWVSPSVKDGKSGSTVTFTVEDNVTGNARTASYTFAIQGAEQKLVIKQKGSELDMNMTLTEVAVSKEDVTLSLAVESEDIDLFSKWGIIYSLTEAKDGGEEIELEGAPAAGTQEVTVTGLTAGTTYYFWAYCEDISGTRHYTETPLTATTEAESTGSGDADGDGIPDQYSEMKENSITITWANSSAVNNLSAITMETLFRWDGFNTEEGIDTMFGVEGGWLVRCMNNFHWIPEDGWFVCSPNGSICFAPFERDDSNTVTDWKGMTQGVWHHLAFTYDSTSGAVAIYLDGQAIVSVTQQLGTVNLYDSSLTDPVFHIGKSYNEKRWFNGAMAEIRLWNRALSSDEINAEGHYYSVDPENAEGLLAYWKLGETGTTVQDYSGNGHHGTAETAF